MDKPTDKLNKIFNLQKEFNKSINVDVEWLHSDQKEMWLLRMAQAIQQEASELVNCCKWKWWKKGQIFDKIEARKEIVDILHFLVSAATFVDMDASDLFEEYCKKNKINFERQEDGY